MILELTEKEEYLIERVMDEHRDKLLMGIAILSEKALKDPKFNEIFSKMHDSVNETFWLFHTICAKLELARLKAMGDKNGKDKV